MSTNRATHWHLITGEYPPDPGGVADYSSRLATGLAELGDSVQIWTGSGPVAPETHPAIKVQRIAGEWNRDDLRRLGAHLDEQPEPRRLLVQYTPNAFRQRGMNWGFCRWLIGRRKKGDDVRIVFHEVRYLERPGDSLGRRLLSWAQRGMVRLLLTAASRVYVTIPYWNQLLEPFAPRRGADFKSIWLPVPSNIPVVPADHQVAEIRQRLAPQGQPIIGNFGTFHDVIGEMVAGTFPPLLQRRPDSVGLLIGRGGDTFAADLRRKFPEIGDRLIATGGIDEDQASRYLQACDLLVQPYPDGVCSKRTSLMAGIANGVAVATTVGKISEPIWEASGAVALASDLDLARLVEVSLELVANPEERRRLAIQGSDLYHREFSLSRLLERLTELDGNEP